MEPSPLPVLRDSSSEGLVLDAPLHPAAEGTEGQQGLQYRLSGAVVSKPT